MNPGRGKHRGRDDTPCGGLDTDLKSIPIDTLRTGFPNPTGRNPEERILERERWEGRKRCSSTVLGWWPSYRRLLSHSSWHLGGHRVVHSARRRLVCRARAAASRPNVVSPIGTAAR